MKDEFGEYLKARVVEHKRKADEAFADESKPIDFGFGYMAAWLEASQILDEWKRIQNED